MEEKKELLIKTLFFYPFRVIGMLISSLSMDDKGLSLKKILAAYATWEAAQITNREIAPNNVIILVFIWLVYAGILVGIYSLGDISTAINNTKSNKQ